MTAAPKLGTFAAAAQSRIGVARLAIVFVVALCVLAPGIRAAFEKDPEAQSAQWIQSIVRDGAWLSQHDAYGFANRKPPLFYWLAAAVAEASGGTVDEVRARIVSLAAAAAICVEVLAWTGAETTPAEGWLAFAFLLGTYGFASRALVALTDMLLTLVVFSAYWLVFRQIEGQVSTRRAIAVGVILGLGLLTKGPVAIMLPGLAVVLYLLMTRRSPFPFVSSGWVWLSLAIAIVIGASWYVPVAILHGREMMPIFAQENFGHFMPARLGGTGEASRPIWFIMARMAGGAMPFTILIPAAAASLFAAEISPAGFRWLIYQSSLVLAVIVFFSLASAKRDDYILPAMPGIAILCASVFGEGARKLRDAGVVIIVAGMLAALAAAIVAGRVGVSSAVLFRPQSSDALIADILCRGIARFDLPYAIFAILMLAGAGMAALATRRRSALGEGIAIAIAALAASRLFIAAVNPDLTRLRSSKTLAHQMRETIDDSPLCIVRGVNYELSFYYGEGVPDLKAGKCASIANSRPAYLFAYATEAESLRPELRSRLRRLMTANLKDGLGPPSVYLIAPEASADLKPRLSGVK